MSPQHHSLTLSLDVRAMCAPYTAMPRPAMNLVCLSLGCALVNPSATISSVGLNSSAITALVTFSRRK